MNNTKGAPYKTKDRASSQLDRFIDDQRKRKQEIERKLAQQRYLSHGYSERNFSTVKVKAGKKDSKRQSIDS